MDFQDPSSFIRLGYLTLKSNVESNYLARELKTVHIDQEAYFIKLLLHSCYINERNIYSQVGIMAVNLCGEMVSTNGIDHLRICSNKKEEKENMEDMSFDLTFDPKTAEKIREIHLAKEKAVAMEDYDQAKKLKIMEEQYKNIGLQLSRLEKQKRQAVANEDYDLAKKIKDEMNLLMQNQFSSMLISPQVITPRSTSLSNRQNNYSEETVVGKGRERNTNTSRMNSGRHNSHRQVGRKEDKEEQEEDEEQEEEEDDEYKEEEEEEREEGGRGAIKKTKNSMNDDGSNSSRRPNPNFQGIPEAENLPDPDEMPDALMKESEEMIDVIGDFFTRCFYSNLWNHRDAVIRKMTMDLLQYQEKKDPFKILHVCSILVQSGTSDRIAQVILSSYRLLKQMVHFGNTICHCKREEMQKIFTNTMTHLINKLGETQAKIKEETQNCLLFLASTKNIGVIYVTSHLIKRSKKPLGLKFLSGRLLVLKEFIKMFELIQDSEFSMPVSICV
jgi:centrosomal protein CEP104